MYHLCNVDAREIFVAGDIFDLVLFNDRSCLAAAASRDFRSRRANNHACLCSGIGNIRRHSAYFVTKSGSVEGGPWYGFRSKRFGGSAFLGPNPPLGRSQTKGMSEQPF